MSENAMQDERDEIERIVSASHIRQRIMRDRVFSSIERSPERENKAALEIAPWVNGSLVISLSCDFASMSHRMSRKNAYELVERVSAWLQKTAKDEANGSNH